VVDVANPLARETLDGEVPELALEVRDPDGVELPAGRLQAARQAVQVEDVEEAADGFRVSFLQHGRDEGTIVEALGVPRQLRDARVERVA